jgi:hypothetical protein
MSEDVKPGNGHQGDHEPLGAPENLDLEATHDEEWHYLSTLRQRFVDQCKKEPIALLAACIGLVAILMIGFQWRAADSVTRIEEAAWINLSFGENAREHVGEFSQSIEITNTGKTPAYRISGESATLLLNKYYVPDFKDETSFTPFLETQPLMVMFPSQSTIVDSPVANRKVTAAEIGDIATGRSFLVTYGRLTYVDVFGDEHEVRFCGVRPQGGPAWIGSQQCNRYNRRN